MVKSFNTISALALAALAQANIVPEYAAPPTPDYAAPPAADYPVPPTYDTPVYDTPAYVPIISSTTCTTETDYPVPTGYEVPPTSYDTPDVEYPHVPVDYATTTDYGHPEYTDVYGHDDKHYDGEHHEYTPEHYVSVYTSCEVVPTVYISEGVECTTDYTKTYELTTTCETPVETPCPTTITKSYETTYSTCITYPTTCETEGTTYVTHTSSTQYSTATVCTTEVYEPKPTPPTTYHSVTPKVYSPPATPTGYPVVNKPSNQTSYVPTYPESTGGASLNGPTLVAFAAVFGGIVAALF